jgi:hypothetical protein
MSILHIIDRSRVWVAFCAASMYAEFVLLTHIPISLLQLLQVFFFTWAAYLFLDGDKAFAKKWTIPTAATGSLFLGTFNFSHEWQIWFLCGALVLLYHRDVFGKNKFSLPFDLRSNAAIKTITIATAWTLLTSVWPAMPVLATNYTDLLPLIISNFFFVAALSLTEDICDSGIDVSSTFATKIGTAKTKWIAVLATVLACIFFHIFNDQLINTLAAVVYAVMVLVILFIITRKSQSTSGWVPLAIDGFFMLRFVLVLSL